MIQPSSHSPILKLEGVQKSFPTSHGLLHILQDIEMELRQGESVAIVGPSGSGKTTLLGLCAGLDLPDQGIIALMNQRLDQADEEQRAKLRQESVGFVFQNFQLIPSLTALENVAIPLELRNDPNALKSARQWLDRVGLGDRESHYPMQLSGGEQQRVAIARACVHQPAILFADEPTGNLDAATGEIIEALLFDTHRENGNTLVVVTHDMELAEKTDRVLPIRAGRFEVK